MDFIWRFHSSGWRLPRSNAAGPRRGAAQTNRPPPICGKTTEDQVVLDLMDDASSGWRVRVCLATRVCSQGTTDLVLGGQAIGASTWRYRAISRAFQVVDGSLAPGE